MFLKNRLILSTALAGLSLVSASFASAAVVVKGNQLVDTAVIMSYVDASGDVDRSIKALYSTGLFRDVSIKKSGGNTVVTVTENPVVNRVAFEGNKKLKDAQLGQVSQIKPRDVLANAKVQEDVQRIVGAYQSMGYSAVSVTPKQIERSGNRVDLVYEIDEERGFGKENIDKISFNGNKAFSDTALRNVVQSRQSRWYNFMSTADVYDPDRVDIDQELIRRFYLKNGYADIDVRSATVQKSSKDGDQHLTFTVDEGSRYRVRNITYRIGIQSLKDSDLKGTLKFRQGSWFNLESVEKTAQSMQNRINSLGYPFAKVEPQLSRDRQNKVVDVAFVITEGARNYVQRIDIVGNTRTRDHVIRRQMKLGEGDPFNAEALKTSERRIKGLNYFDKVNVSVREGSAPDQSVVRVDVSEKSTASLNFGAGYSSVDGVVGTISYAERNLFGLGQLLKADLEIGGRYQKANLSFTEPYFLNKPISAGFDLFYNQRDYQDESSYDRLDYGVSLRLGYRLNDYLTQSWNYSLQYNEINNVPKTASRYIAVDEGDRIKSSLSHTLTYDGRDSSFDTRRGVLLSMTNEFAGIGGDAKYIRTSGRASVWQPLYRDIIFSAHARAGHIYSLGDKSESIHLFDRYHLGQPLVRGFSSAGIDPRDAVTGDALGGNWYAAATAQIDFPMPTPKDLGFSGHIFLDAGRIGQNDFQPAADINHSNSWRYSAGGGVTWNSPMGPLTLDYAIPLNAEDFDDESRFYFYVGTQF